MELPQVRDEMHELHRTHGARPDAQGSSKEASNLTIEVRGQVPLEEIPYHYEGERLTIADARWSRVVAQVHEHLPLDVLVDLEDAHGELMEIAFAYGTRCEPGDDPLLNALSDEEYEARTGEPRPTLTTEQIEEGRRRLRSLLHLLSGEQPPDTLPR
jgi:hypothetical protein